ncbi:MAG: fatty acid desaturase [Deltaproteobacteria bacterium]|nr:fatty acid desaturase [Deltaproteobacteria bacterium]
MNVNLNYHLEHHLYPSMPWYNLPRLHALLQDNYRQAGSFIYKSYMKFLWDAFRAGVHGLAPEQSQWTWYPGTGRQRRESLR